MQSLALIYTISCALVNMENIQTHLSVKSTRPYISPSTSHPPAKSAFFHERLNMMWYFKLFPKYLCCYGSNCCCCWNLHAEHSSQEIYRKVI